MKLFGILLHILCSGSSVLAQLSPALNEVSVIRNGIEKNDAGSFEAASKLPAEIAVPILRIYALDVSTDKLRAERASEALRRVPGFSEYMKRSLDEKIRSGYYSSKLSDDFSLLATVGGDGSAKVVAPYLFFKDTDLTYPSGDFSVPSPRQDACIALNKMMLSDGPPGKKPWDYAEKDIYEWRQWAIKNGYFNDSDGRLNPKKAAPTAGGDTVPRPIGEGRKVGEHGNGSAGEIDVKETVGEHGFWSTTVFLQIGLIVVILGLISVFIYKFRKR